MHHFRRIVRFRTLGTLNIRLTKDIVRANVFRALTSRFRLLGPFHRHVAFARSQRIVLRAFLRHFASHRQVFAIAVVIPTIRTVREHFGVELTNVTRYTLLNSELLRVRAYHTAGSRRIRRQITTRAIDTICQCADSFAGNGRSQGGRVFTFLVRDRYLANGFNQGATRRMIAN